MLLQIETYIVFSVALHFSVFAEFINCFVRFNSTESFETEIQLTIQYVNFLYGSFTNPRVSFSLFIRALFVIINSFSDLNTERREKGWKIICTSFTT